MTKLSSPPFIGWWPSDDSEDHGVQAALHGVFSAVTVNFTAISDEAPADKIQKATFCCFALSPSSFTAAESAIASLEVQKAKLSGKRAALIISSSKQHQPDAKLEIKLAALLKKAGFIYIGAYWHYAGAHAAWLKQNSHRLTSFKARLESENAFTLKSREP